jgi:cytochrome d ubiquinol oxidase subunit II
VDAPKDTWRRQSRRALRPGFAFAFLGYTGFVISLWPNIIPPSVSIGEAAAPPQSIGLTLVGALFIIPFIFAYTAWSSYVFRGKVRGEDGYH